MRKINNSYDKISRFGFTLIELLAVIVILALLAIVAIPTVAKKLDKSKDGLYETQLVNIKDAAIAWGTNNIFKLPDDENGCIAVTLKQLQDGGYIDFNIVNPKTGEKFDNNETFVNVIKNGNNYDYKVQIKGEKCTIAVEDNLPFKYQELEYIESNGYQYINTGFNPNENTGIEVKFTTIKKGQAIFGSRIDSTPINAFAAWQSNGWRMQFGSMNATDSSVDVSGDNPHLLIKRKNTDYLDGKIIHQFNKESFDSSLPIYLFGINEGGVFKWGLYGKIYYSKIFDNDIIVRNLIPCYRKSDGEIGMYDIVNNMFYTNSGTGDFIAGPEVNS